MNYAWEAVLLAEEYHRERDSLRFVEAVTPSPYIEVSVTDLNSKEPEEDCIEINPLYRFEDVFGKLFDKNNRFFSISVCTILYSLTCGKAYPRKIIITAC